MNADNTIRDLIKTHLSDNHKVDVVKFIDQLFLLNAGEIKCTLAGDRNLRFQIGNQAAWDVELGRARSKLRMMCARLGVLCNESGNQDVSLYGGEGFIHVELPAQLPDNLGRSSGSDFGSSTNTSSVAHPALECR